MTNRPKNYAYDYVKNYKYGDNVIQYMYSESVLWKFTAILECDVV
jgi:hypothetical protein